MRLPALGVGDTALSLTHQWLFKCHSNGMVQQRTVCGARNYKDSHAPNS